MTNLWKCYRQIIVVTLSYLLFAPAILVAAENVATQSGTPHKLLIGDYSAKVLAIVDAKGEIEWQHPIRNIHDAWRLTNGNILFQADWNEVLEVTPDHKTVWKYRTEKPNEIHAFQRLENGRTMVAESGAARIIEVDRDGKIVSEVRLKVEHPHPHTDTRQVRKLKSGNYLVAHEGANQVVREYAPNGKIVWEFRTGTKVYSAIRLENGNTLIGTGDGHRVIEVNPAGQTVWSIEQNELPGMTLGWITMVDRLANGNTMFVNCHAGEANPQIVEVDPAKRVVWSFKDYRRFGNSLPVAVFLD